MNSQLGSGRVMLWVSAWALVVLGGCQEEDPEQTEPVCGVDMACAQDLGPVGGPCPEGFVAVDETVPDPQCVLVDMGMGMGVGVGMGVGSTGMGADMGSPPCSPGDCAALGAGCGTLPDGCGGTVDCGQCPQGQSYGLGGPMNVGLGRVPP